MIKVFRNRFLSSFYTLICVLSLNWFLPIFNSLLAEASLYSRFEISIYLVSIVSLELLFFFVVTKFYKGVGARHLQALILAFILTVNLIGLLLTFYEPFLIQGKIYKAGEFVLLTSVLYGLFLALDRKKHIVAGLSLLYMFMVAQQGVVLATGENDQGKTQVFSQFKPVVFTKKPNIYILSFDSLIPQNLPQSILDWKTYNT